MIFSLTSLVSQVHLTVSSQALTSSSQYPKVFLINSTSTLMRFSAESKARTEEVRRSRKEMTDCGGARVGDGCATIIHDGQGVGNEPIYRRVEVGGTISVWLNGITNGYMYALEGWWVLTNRTSPRSAHGFVVNLTRGNYYKELRK